MHSQQNVSADMQHYKRGGRSKLGACLGGDGLPTEAAHSNSQPPFSERTARALPQHHLRPVVLHCHTHMPAHRPLFSFHTCATHMLTAGEPSVNNSRCTFCQCVCKCCFECTAGLVLYVRLFGCISSRQLQSPWLFGIKMAGLLQVAWSACLSRKAVTLRTLR